MAVLFVVFAMKEKETARLEARGARRRKGRGDGDCAPDRCVAPLRNHTVFDNTACLPSLWE